MSLKNLGLLALFPTLVLAGPQQQFFAALGAQCGKAFEARVVESEAADQDWREARIVMHVRDCSDSELRIPLQVGENRSRIWVLRKTSDGLELKHDHRHQDGSEDRLSQYGGHTVESGSAGRQAFPADAHSQALFKAQGLDAAVANTWILEIEPGKHFSYGLSRPGRRFRMEFDLTRPVAPPPPAWDQASGVSLY
ncbi:hypothetical protein [Gallaecimonas sp. GXIMD4217]|uniref:hypothetical protein n=1 Tax=Gallaecimonas sp. GXIMD4217 TaxID=3131927 RepID=UPI00311AF547